MTSRRDLLKYMVAVGGLTVGGVASLMPRRANSYYAGPISDHFNGSVFFNPGGPKLHSYQQFARLQFTETWAPWPARIESPHVDRPPAAVDDATVRLSFVGHASWLMQTSGLNILIDPVWSERASPFSFAGPKRANDPGIAFDDLPRIDVVLVTHNHYDHLDTVTLGRLWERHRPRMITPLGNDTIMRQDVPGLTASTVDWHDSVALSPRVRVSAVPTLHWSARGLRDRRHALWASFVIETPAGAIYAVGDSGFGDGGLFRDIGRQFPDLALALLPIGAYEPRWFMQGQHMNPAEAVAAFRQCGARTALGHHWGTFALTAEPPLLPVHALAQAMIEQDISAERFVAVRPGQVHVLGA